MTNMKVSSSSDSTSDLMTAAMTSAAMLSCTIARAAANRVEPGFGSRPDQVHRDGEGEQQHHREGDGQARVDGHAHTVCRAPSRGGRRARHPWISPVASTSGRLGGCVPSTRRPPPRGECPGPRSDRHAARRTHHRTQQHRTPAGDLWQAARKRHPSCSVSTSSTRASLKTDIPAFRAGDNVKVHVKVVEGTRSRIQVFQGVVIRRHGGGVGETFTVRKVSFGVGVERTFPLHTPIIDHIELVTRGDVRRAKLYYLRDLRGKAAKIKEKRDTPVAR